MYLGVDWYPDQWGLGQMEEDLDGIEELGCNIVRIADFAWHIFEPEEGRYEFDYFDKVIEAVKRRGLKVLFCVPTATMPPWLEKKYPEISEMDEKGNRIPYGGRRAYCLNSPIYRKKAADLTRELIKHYKDEDCIVAWQVDNEIGHEGSDMCWCEECRRGFDKMLEEKYPSIEDLNQRWGTDFWSHHYDSFKDIPLPKKAYVAQNPSMRLEWERFRSLSVKSFIGLLRDTIKEVSPEAVVLHDFCGGIWDKHFDAHDTSKVLDEIAVNNYPVWGGMAIPHPAHITSFQLDTARGFKKMNFWVTEEIMGAQGHDVIGAAPKPDQAVVWAMQAMAHGCENMLFFRYRGFTKGAEQFCFGILDSDNRKKRKFYEVQRFFREVKAHEDAFTSPIVNKAAVLFDYDSAAAFRIQQQSSEFSYEGEAIKLYEQLWNRGIGTDILSSEEDFSDYKLIVLPSMIVMKEDFKKRLKEYVEKGGVAVMDFRTAWKDTDNNLPFKEILPWGLTDLIGGTLEEQESLLKDQYREVVSSNGKEGEGRVFAEMYQATDGEVLVSYKNCPFGDYAAVLRKKYGEGRAYYLGTSLEKDMLNDVFTEAVKDAGLPVRPNTKIETVYRKGKEADWQFTLDFENFRWDIRKV